MKSPNDTVVSLHAGTPEVAVAGSTGALILSLRFLRHPDVPDAPARLLKSCTILSVPERTSRQYGSRPLRDDTGHLLPDAVTVMALSGQSIMLHTADGDAGYALSDAAGRPLWSRSAQGTVKTFTWEAANTAGRLLALTEINASGCSRVHERFIWAPVDEAGVKAHNLAGIATMHYDNAGFTQTLSISLTGNILKSEQRLLPASAPEPDWSAVSQPETEAPLSISSRYDATGAVLSQTNAADVTLITAYNVAGGVREKRLHFTDKRGILTNEVITLCNIMYRADGVVLSQTAGNGITEKYEYHSRTQYLLRHTTARPPAHALGGCVISDLHYEYDPVGNILRLEDKATVPVWHNNQQATGLRTYEYDTLYRLILATGRERGMCTQHRGPFPRMLADPTAGMTWNPYTEVYRYDDGDNLIAQTHSGTISWTQITTVSARSNRGMVQNSGQSPVADPHRAYLAGGLRKALDDGRSLAWHADGQLSRVTPVSREANEEDDVEQYRYAAPGTRVRKVRLTKAAGGIQTSVTTYAGGCETRWRALNNSVQLNVCVTEAGGVRVIHDVLKHEIHLRYGLSDHLGSVIAETEETGNITSREEYYPYGGSAGADEESAETRDRARRYSGKERDATGMMYYGWRYYQPEAGRWLSADPGGLIDGVNLFRFAQNNPMNVIDTDGRGSRSAKNAVKTDTRDEAEAGRAEPAVSTEMSLEDRKKEAVKELSIFFEQHAYYSDDSDNLQWLYDMDMGIFSTIALEMYGESGFSAEDANDILKRAVRRGLKSLKKEREREKRKARQEQKEIEKKEAADAAMLAEEAIRKQKSLFAIWAHDSPGIQKGGETSFNARKVKLALQDKMDEGVDGKKSWSATEGADVMNDIDDLDGYSYAVIAQKLDNAIDKMKKKEKKVLYRGIDQLEFSRWNNSGPGSVFSSGRFTAFSGSESVAQKFGSAGIVEIEAGASGGARVGKWYANVHEDEVLFRRDARFFIRNISGKRIKARFQ